ncbi:MAG: hypothetical protein EOO44_11145 [Flavobacterium sp.]|nr:MAG: hypothetical protein EOO44_11145 [Flavobacterium sp.]
MDYDEKLLRLIAFSNLKGIGAVMVKKSLDGDSLFGNNIFADLKNAAFVNNKSFNDSDIDDSLHFAEQVIKKCDYERIEILTLIDPDYPVLLKGIKNPPPIIYYKGNKKLFQSKAIAIIGTREPNENGKKIAERIGEYYGNAGFQICNGLSVGIDSEAIKDNMSLNKGVIGVMAGGLNFQTSKTLSKFNLNNALKNIEANGLIISECPPDKKEDTFTVVKSCRIQAGLSSAVIVVQSSINGGTRFAVRAFCETNRPIAVVNPIDADFESLEYEANKELVINGKRGLGKFTEIKNEKMLRDPFIIKSKNDYSKFRELIDSEELMQKTRSNTLFD